MNYWKLVETFPDLFRNENAALEVITNSETILEWQEARKLHLAKDDLCIQWAEIGVILDDPYIIGIRDLVRFPDGRLNGYIRLIDRASMYGGQSVAILPFIKESKTFLLLKQFRHATRSWHLEIPRGFGEPNVPTLEQAKVELWEEARISTDEFVDLGLLHVNTGPESTATQLFFVHGKTEGTPNVIEGIDDFVFLSLDELESHIDKGQITDSFTIAAYTRAKLRQII